MTVSTVTDNHSRTTSYSTPKTGRQSPENQSISLLREAATTDKPIVLASAAYVPLTEKDIVPTLGSFVERQDAFNGAVGSIKDDAITLKADSQTDAGIAITLTQPISGRMSFSCKGCVETESYERSKIITVQFIKAGANYDYKQDEIIDERHIFVYGDDEHVLGKTEGSFKIPEGTDKVVVMKTGESSFDVDISGVGILKPVSIPAEAICKEFRSDNTNLQYYPREEYDTVNLWNGWHIIKTIEVVNLPRNWVAGYPGDYVLMVSTGSGIRWDPGRNTTHLNLTHGVIYSESSGKGGCSNYVLRMSDNGFESKLNDIIESLRSPEFERNTDNAPQSKLSQPIPPEIQALIKLLENYITKHPEQKE